eukprot:gnl/Hemi2/1249_TR445_c0_g1_i1.p1 gnl/Hemi2/1249_TR445_c0_g1~~gnl/Hemi2/1249_TR445_c0_g1_i1.p1  ORF type:complete len:533 (-),score=216.17 gnl/Hemi2/1249_TR445_c0_g1_i1:93-1691(-)
MSRLSFVCVVCLVLVCLVGVWAEISGDTIVETEPTLSQQPAVAKAKRSWLVYAGALLVFLLIADQVNFRMKRGSLPGPNLLPPFIGKFIDSCFPKFEKYMAQWNSGPLSCTSVFQKFIVIGTTNEISRKMFSSPSALVPCLVASMKQILTPTNWVFLQGPAHAEYRRGLNPLFTRQALSIYLPIQERIYLKHIKSWLDLKGKEEVYQMKFRELAMETSLRVFCGEYMSDAICQEISVKFNEVTKSLSLVNFPFAWPGTQVWKAIQSRKFIVEHISIAAAKSRERMSRREPAACLLDAWLQEILQVAPRSEEAAQRRALRDFSNEEIALTVLTFIFASQDASTASMTWAAALLADYPDVLGKIRAEQLRLRPNNEPLNMDLMDQMVYAKQVVKEVLRYRPPVIMVPYESIADCPITETYTVPKGTIVVPSVYPSLHDPEAYKDPESFDPDRFGPERKEDEKSPKHYMVFGHGNHYCLGKEYAMSHLQAFIVTMATTMNWKHIRTAQSDDINIFATIYPMDGCILSTTPRLETV